MHGVPSVVLLLVLIVEELSLFEFDELVFCVQSLNVYPFGSLTATHLLIRLKIGGQSSIMVIGIGDRPRAGYLQAVRW